MAYILYMDHAMKDGKLVHVDTVANGKKCGCTCPCCGASLSAKQGSKQRHHFAHLPGADCKHGYESALHVMAKEILSEAKYFKTPPVSVHMESHDEILYPSKKIKIINADLEKRIDDNQIIPDVVLEAEFSGGRTASLLVEIFVTHKVDEIKKQKLIDNNLPTVEIDLSEEEDYITREQLQDILLNDSDQKKWVYNKFSYTREQQYQENCDKLSVRKVDNAWYTDGCPRSRYTYENNDYANLADCKCCPDCLSITDEDNYLSKDNSYDPEQDPPRVHVKCLAHITHDNITELNRITDLNYGRFCPVCGTSLWSTRTGYSKSFLRCPVCHFSTYQNPKNRQYQDKGTIPRKSIKNNSNISTHKNQ